MVYYTYCRQQVYGFKASSVQSIMLVIEIQNIQRVSKLKILWIQSNEGVYVDHFEFHSFCCTLSCCQLNCHNATIHDVMRQQYIIHEKNYDTCKVTVRWVYVCFVIMNYITTTLLISCFGRFFISFFFIKILIGEIVIFFFKNKLYFQLIEQKT